MSLISEIDYFFRDDKLFQNNLIEIISSDLKFSNLIANSGFLFESELCAQSYVSVKLGQQKFMDLYDGTRLSFYENGQFILRQKLLSQKCNFLLRFY